VIPLICIEELDDLKSGYGEVPYSARKALRKIRKYALEGDISEGILLPGGGTLKVISGKENFFIESKPDNLIVSCAIELKNKGASNVIVVSKDAAVMIKSGAMDIPAQDYKRDKTTLFKKYGFVLQNEEYNNGILSVRYQQRGDDFFRIWGKDSEDIIRIGRELNDISPKNIEQACAIDALTNPDIKVVALTGKAGSGKTLLALAAATHQVTKKCPLFKKVLVMRPPVPIHGYDMGFLPGDISEKIDPWMQPIYDNLDVLYPTPVDGGESKGARSQHKSYQFLIEKKQLDIGNLTYIRGRSLPEQYIIVDEAQNLRPNDMKTLATRLGEGSKIVFTGDLDQIDTPYLDAESNGLAYLIARLINEEDFCYLRMKKSARSSLADRMAELL